MRRRDLIAAGLILPTAAAAQQGAAPRQALLMEGKRTLRQRVLTRPNAAPRPEPGRPAAGTALNPLTPLFVYARRPGPDGRPWIEIGRAAQGATLGWIPAAEALDWPHTLSAVFQPQGGRPRTLFFEQRDPVIAMMGGRDPSAEARRLAEQAARPPLPAGFPVVAMEPATAIDIRRQFYLLPILQAEHIVFQDSREFRAVEVASIPVGETPPPPRREFGLDIAFVVDTTLSMGPYIDRVRTALNQVVQATAGAGQRRTRYALVGFRNSLDAQPRLDYLVRTYARFGDALDPASFARRVAAMQATDVDSLSFNEDSFAAIRSSIQDLDWAEGAGRIIVLVTDAGSRAATDRLSATRLGPSELGAIAREAGTAIMVMHLLTPQGRNNHRQAQQQYTTLSSMPLPALGPQYFPVPNGDAEATNEVARGLIRGIATVAEDRAAAQAAQGGGGRGAQAGQQAEERAALVGHALRLAWLGRQDRAAAPDLLRAWAADRYREGWPAECLEVRILLTRNQLNDLGQSLRAIIDVGRRNALDTDAMYDRLAQTAAALARDPDRLRQRGLEQLGDILGEFVDGLPYRSRIAGMTREEWRQLEPGERDEILNELDARQRAYDEFNRSPIWWPPDARQEDRGDQMFLVPLDLLP
jgi:serine/threonine-protein kinase PpkA